MQQAVRWFVSRFGIAADEPDPESDVLLHRVTLAVSLAVGSGNRPNQSVELYKNMSLHGRTLDLLNCTAITCGGRHAGLNAGRA